MASAPKRYYWLKLPKDFFQTKEIKRLRRIAGGDTFTVIYLKMMLKTLTTDGKLYYEGFEDSFISELAMDIDEEEQNVSITVQYLLKYGLLEVVDESEYIMPKVANSIGSETASAERKRRQREKEKQLKLCDIVTPLSQIGHVEKEIEKELKKELKKEIDTEKEKEPSGGGVPNSVIYLEYEKNGFGQISGFIKELIDSDIEEYGADWCKYAMIEAVEHNARNWRYVVAILKRWKERYALSAKPWEVESEPRNQTNNRKDASQGKTWDENTVYEDSL